MRRGDNILMPKQFDLVRRLNPKNVYSQASDMAALNSFQDIIFL